MRDIISKILTVILTLFVVFGENAAGQDISDKSAVRITFDDNAKRMDIITEEPIPAYKFAKRGSIQFHLWNINEPQDYLTYLHDGIRKAPIETLTSIEKIQEPFNVWIISFKEGGRNSPRIRELAISFIPISDNGTQGERVYLLLKEFRHIDWE